MVGFSFFNSVKNEKEQEIGMSKKKQHQQVKNDNGNKEKEDMLDIVIVHTFTKNRDFITT